MLSIEDRLNAIERRLAVIERRHPDRVSAMDEADDAISLAHDTTDHY